MSNARSIWSAIISVTLWQLFGETLGAQPSTWVTPRAARTTDAVIARDLATFDSLARGAPSPRSAAVIGLARDAYERNEAGPLSERLLSVARRRDNDPRLRAVRGELWALLDSVDTHAAKTDQQRELAVALEVALLRAGSPVLGAPSCAAWAQEALRIATSLRAVPEPPAPVPALAVPRETRGLPSRGHFALDKHALAPATRRVDAVRQYGESKGIAASRIRLVARGKSQLENDRAGVIDHARNRRVLLRYFAPDGREIAAVQQLDDLQLERR